jgi:amphi-Trp domain-containing protein
MNKTNINILVVPRRAFDDGMAFISMRVVRGRMPEEVLFETENKQSRTDIAAYLRTVADKLESGEPITLSAGSQSVTLEPPARPVFEVKAERETSSTDRTETSVEFELEWKEGEDGDDGSLAIE